MENFNIKVNSLAKETCGPGMYSGQVRRATHSWRTRSCNFYSAGSCRCLLSQLNSFPHQGLNPNMFSYSGLCAHSRFWTYSGAPLQTGRCLETRKKCTPQEPSNTLHWLSPQHAREVRRRSKAWPIGWWDYADPMAQILSVGVAAADTAHGLLWPYRCSTA